MKLRSEVEEALRDVRAKYGPGRKPTRTQLLALVELGVRLGVADCCDPACTIEDISQETVNDILQAQPEGEGEGNG